MTIDSLVSVIMPSYNHSRFVEQAIRSVWTQTHSAIELIVVDDCSPDDTFDVAKALVDASPIPMTVLQNPKNMGITGTLNHALEHVRGDWVSILASDDWYAPQKIRRQLEEAAKLGDEYGCIHSDSYLVTEAGDVLETVYTTSTLPPMRDQALLDLAYGRANMVAITALIRVPLLTIIGGFDASLRAEDFDLHLSLAKRTRYGFVAEPLTYSRMIDGSLGKSPAKYLPEMFRVLEKHREDLEPNFDDIMRTRALHGVNIAAAHQFWEGLMSAIDLGVDYSHSGIEIAEFLGKSALVLGGLLGRDVLADHTDARLRRILSRAYQSWLYKGFGN